MLQMASNASSNVRLCLLAASGTSEGLPNPFQAPRLAACWGFIRPSVGLSHCTP
jgi:hypothetical protein